MNPHRSTAPPRRNTPVFLFGLLFFATVFAAYAWFNTDILRSNSQLSTLDSSLWLQARTNIPGYTFIREPVSEAVMKTLGTTNILSGTFFKVERTSDQPGDVRRESIPVSGGDTQTAGADPERITVFMCSWPASAAAGLNFLHHTPDICWGMSGWKAIDNGQPALASIEFQTDATRADSPATMRIPFECRVFQHPLRGQQEFVAWTALVGGRSVSAVTERDLASTAVKTASNPRMGLLHQFSEATKERLPVRGTKQFARFSIPVDGQRLSPDRVSSIGSAWLSIDQSRPNPD